MPFNRKNGIFPLLICLLESFRGILVFSLFLYNEITLLPLKEKKNIYCGLRAFLVLTFLLQGNDFLVFGFKLSKA